MGLILRTSVVLAAILWLSEPVCATPARTIDVDSLSRPRIDTFEGGVGLPNLTLLSVSATPDGHVWAGTMRGLARFNGLRFMPVQLPDDGAVPGMVNSVLALNKKQVWVAPSNRGVYLWNGNRWQHFRPGLEFPGHDVRRLRAFSTRDGVRVFATTNEGMIAVWDGKHWTELPVNYRLRGKEIFDVLPIYGRTAKDDVFWVATYRAGLLRCQADQTCTEIQLPGDSRFFEISSLRSVLEVDGSVSIWAGSYGGGVARLNKGAWQRFNADGGMLNGDYVHDLEVVHDQDSEPEIWVGGRNGISSYRAGGWKRYGFDDHMPQGRVWALATSYDDDGRAQLWAATDNGAVRLHLRGDLRIVRRVSDDANGVWAVRFENEGDGRERLWLGSDGDGLWRYEGGQWTQFGKAQGLESNVVRSITRLPTGALWLGLWNGHIASQDGQRFRTLSTPWPKGPQQAVNAFLNDSSGGVWAGLREGGVAHYQSGRWRYFNSNATGAPEFILGLAETGGEKDPVIWASSNGAGLARYHNGQWRRFNTWNSELPDDELVTLQAKTDDRQRTVLWIGSKNRGLIRMDVSNINRPRLITQPELPDPPHPYVYGTVQNSRGDVVVCTDYGAAFWRSTGSGRYRAVNYHRKNGLPHDECNAGALVFDRYDRAWIGTIGGAAVLLPATQQTTPATLSLERLRLDGKEQPLAEGPAHYRAAFSDVSLDFEFALLTGERESESMFRIHIVGLDDSPGPWQQSNQYTVSKLSAGDYVLRIEAMDFSGAMAQPMEVRLSVPLPWWRSWWVTGMLALLAVGTLLLIINWRERRLRVRESELVSLVEKRTGQLERRGKELRRINDELRRLSYRDSLTGVANRRKLLEILDSSWLQAQRENYCIGFILLDVDDFKAINDTEGHLRGDECLQSIARCLEQTLNGIPSTLGRYGGEEFGILLPHTSIARAIEVAEACCHDVEQLQFPHPTSIFGIVTLSLGVACLRPGPQQTSDVLIAKADGALYEAKQNGKNRVELADSSESRA